MVVYLIERLRVEGAENVDVRVEDVFKLTLDENSMDRIFMIACLPEIPYPREAVKELVRVLKPGGLLSTCELLFDPDYPLMSTEKKWMAEAGLDLHREYYSLLSYQLVWEKTS